MVGDGHRHFDVVHLKIIMWLEKVLPRFHGGRQMLLIKTFGQSP